MKVKLNRDINTDDFDGYMCGLNMCFDDCMYKPIKLVLEGSTLRYNHREKQSIEYDVLYNGKATVVFGDGVKGISKWDEEECYIPQKGAEIALARMLLKKHGLTK